MADFQFYAKAFITVLLLVNPLEGIPVFSLIRYEA